MRALNVIIFYSPGTPPRSADRRSLSLFFFYFVLLFFFFFFFFRVLYRSRLSPKPYRRRTVSRSLHERAVVGLGFILLISTDGNSRSPARARAITPKPVDARAARRTVRETVRGTVTSRSLRYASRCATARTVIAADGHDVRDNYYHYEFIIILRTCHLFAVEFSLVFNAFVRPSFTGTRAPVNPVFVFRALRSIFASRPARRPRPRRVFFLGIFVGLKIGNGHRSPAALTRVTKSSAKTIKKISEFFQ